MIPVDQFECEGTKLVIFARDQPEYIPLPALAFPDGKILTEWALSAEEREAIAKGENVRLWIWLYPHVCPRCQHQDPPLLQPVALDLTSEHHG